MEGRIKATGQVHLKFFEGGELVHEVIHHNLVTNYGLTFMAGAIAQTDGRTIAQMGIGKSSQPPSPQDAWLMSESARVNCSVSSSGAVISINATFGEGVGTSTITELALFGSGDGVAFARSVIPGQAKSDTTTIQVLWTITLQST